MTTLTNQFYKFLHEVSEEEADQDYYNLAICIRSGQVSAQQVQEHLKDKDFHDYYMNNFYQSLTLWKYETKNIKP